MLHSELAEPAAQYSERERWLDTTIAVILFADRQQPDWLDIALASVRHKESYYTVAWVSTTGWHNRYI